MTPQEWQAEFARREAISEGLRLYKYLDSVGVVTVGYGFNCERGDARQAIELCGGDWNAVHAAPIARDADPENAVAPCITHDVAMALLSYSLRPIVGEARDSLPPGVFDEMTDARRFVICDLIYNMGDGGWLEFKRTRAAIATAEQAKEANAVNAHALFVEAAADLAQSDWYAQVGDRAKRDVAMLRQGVWCNPLGDGSDI